MILKNKDKKPIEDFESLLEVNSIVEDDEEDIVILEEEKRKTMTDELFEDLGIKNSDGELDTEIEGEGIDNILEILTEAKSSKDQNNDEMINLSTSKSSKKLTKEEKQALKQAKKEQKALRKKNAKLNGKNDFIKMENSLEGSAEEDFIIVGSNGNKLNNIGYTVKLIFITVLSIFATALIIFSSLFKIVPADVKGGEVYIDNQYSIVSRDHQPNLDELRVNDTILLENENLSWIPLVYDFKLYRCESRKGKFIYVVDSEGKESKIEYSEIDYVLK